MSQAAAQGEIRGANGELWVPLAQWAEFRGSTLENEANRATRGHYFSRQFPSEKHTGKMVTYVALHHEPAQVQREYQRWRSRLGPQGAEHALAEIKRGFDTEAARMAGARYQAVQAYLAIQPRTLVIEGRRVPSPAVMDLCQARGIEQRTLRRWAEAFQSALDEARTPEAIYRAFQILIPGKRGKVVRPDDGRLTLRPEDELLIQGLWAQQGRRSAAKIFTRLVELCIHCRLAPMQPVHHGFKSRYGLHRCENAECGFTISYAAVRAAVKRTPPSAEALGRWGRKYYDDRFGRSARRDWSGAGRNQFVFGDHHQLDVFVYDPARPFLDDGKTPRIFSPWLSAWQDVASSVVAWRIALRPNAQLLSLAFRAYVLRFGVPQEAWCDNGKDYISERFETLCLSLGVELHHTLPSNRESGESHARSKPIERWFGTLERDLVQELPAWRGPNTQERNEDLLARWEREHAEFLRGERPATPLLTDEELRQRVEAWVEQRYHKLPTARQDRAPLDAFSADSHAVHTISERALDVLLWEAPRTRVLGGNGVRVDGQLYWSRELFGHEGEKCRVLRDPGEVSKVVVILTDPRAGAMRERPVIAYADLPVGTSAEDIQRARELQRDQRRVVRQALAVRHQAAAGIRPLDQVLLEKHAQAQPVAAVAGGVPLVTEGHRIAAALDRAPAPPGHSAIRIPHSALEEGPRLLTILAEPEELDEAPPPPLRRFEDEE